MNFDTIVPDIITVIISFVGSFLISLLTIKYKLYRKGKEDKEENYYNRFRTIWDNIHRGRAYNFINLNGDEQERIIRFFIDTNKYQNEEEKMLVYELKTAHLNDFNNRNRHNIDTANEAYRRLIDLLVNQNHR